MRYPLPRHQIPLSLKEIQLILSSQVNTPASESISELEEGLERYFGARHAIALSSGRLSLFLSLKAIGITENSTVILPSYCFYTLVEVVRSIGANIIWGQISPQTFALDIDFVTENIHQTDVIIFIQPFGQVIDLRELRNICDQNQVALIEDASQSTGASISSIYAGTMGHIGVFSLVKAKNLQAFGGGFILTDNSDWAVTIKKQLSPNQKSGRKALRFGALSSLLTTKKLFSLSLYPALTLLSRANPASLQTIGQEERHPFQTEPPYYQISPKQALFVMCNLSSLSSRNTARRQNGEMISYALREHPYLKLQQFSPEAKHSFHALALRVPDGVDFAKYMLKHGIDIRQDYMEWFGDRAFSEDIVYLPTYPSLRPEERQHIIDISLKYKR